MKSPENNGSDTQDTRRNIHEKGHIHENETNPIDLDFFKILWKHKWFIFFASVLPALVVGLVLFLGPKNYKITYTYNMTFGEKAFKVLEDTFYSAENLGELVEKLRENGLDRYAQRLAGTEIAGDLKQFVSFEVSPPYFEEFSKVKNLEELQKLQAAKGSLLIMRVGAKSGENIQKIASVYRKNFEQIIPLYSVKEELNTDIENLKEEMAIIEETRYTLDLQLEGEKSTLEKLKNAGSVSSDKPPSDIILQLNIEPLEAEDLDKLLRFQRAGSKSAYLFPKAKNLDELQRFQNIGDNSAYLPLSYQVQAEETRIINLEEQIKANKKMYSYYVDLLSLNEKLLGYVKKAMPSYCTLEQFHLFLSNTLEEYKNQQEISDYLKAYIKRTENKIATAIPLVEGPRVYPVAKGTVRKTATVFMIALIISIFVAFLQEGRRRS